MQVDVGTGSIHDWECSAVVVLSFDGNTEPGDVTRSGQLSGSVAALDAVSGGYFQRQLDAGELPTKLGKVSVFHQVSGVTAPRVAVVGAGRQRDFDVRAAFRCGGAGSKCLADRNRPTVAFDFALSDDRLIAAAISGAMNGCIGQDLFRSERSLHPIQHMRWWSATSNAVQRGTCLGEGIALARELVNLPPNFMYPEAFTERAAEVAVGEGIELEIWDELRLRRERCAALLAVSAGSARPPRLLIMRYAGTKKQAPLALVGKGVTFDSGGLSLKPSEGMLNMKCDMAGAASVLATMQTLARLQIATPVVAVIGLVENMISGSCYKLGDVLTARSGKTIEIHNTDAEGRLVLADALNVALDEKPGRIVDLATLTGACLVALGTEVAGLMSNNPQWQAELQTAANQAGEWVWPLPMHPHFGDQIQSKVADIKNVGEGRWGGAITAAKFLEEFVADVPWAHLDIAGPAFFDSPKSYMDAGGTGVMVRTLVELADAL